MKTERAYYGYSGDAALQAEILELKPWGDKTALILDKTIFYPEGGGQSADRGTINGLPLLDVREEGEDILHILSAEDGVTLRPGPGELVLDTVRRRDFTVHHTAQHLLSGTILRLTGFPTVSMHLGDEVCTIDVDAPAFPEETIIAVEEAVQDAVEADAPVVIHLCPPENLGDFPLRKVPPQGEEVIRVVEIRGNDFSPCCGTHLDSTGHIGMLRILGAEKYKGKTRISFIAGRRVLRDSRLLRKNGDIASRALKVPVAETGPGVLALLDRMNQLERKIKALEEENAASKAEALLKKAGLPVWDGGGDPPGRGSLLVRSFPEAGMDEVLAIGRAVQKLTGALIVLAAEGEFKFAAFCSDKKAHLPSILKNAMEAAGGHGGGGSSFFQGVFPGSRELELFLEALPKTF
ncbi:MAG: alanyl-tRNA editing protein [Spirochaetaceae bacterium]|jgi:alanyl-tRNA synthetase|nr:alanyl-tRNA editing protein [Spirochaetaceae bacterium]